MKANRESNGTPDNPSLKTIVSFIKSKLNSLDEVVVNLPDEVLVTLAKEKLEAEGYKAVTRIEVKYNDERSDVSVQGFSERNYYLTTRKR